MLCYYYVYQWNIVALCYFDGCYNNVYSIAFISHNKAAYSRMSHDLLTPEYHMEHGISQLTSVHEYWNTGTHPPTSE